QIQMEHATRDGEMVTVDVAGTVDQAVAAGLLHPNCRHSLSAFLPGITTARTPPDRPAATPPPQPSFRQRVTEAAEGDEARQAAPLSLPRLDDLEAIQRQDQISSLRQYRGQAYININQALRAADE